ncbi:MAG: hypothetical protein MJY86_08045 [Bacteroidales bacterium]|nr:hypothetical protein [Bacteroidales bacterium]
MNRLTVFAALSLACSMLAFSCVEKPEKEDPEKDKPVVTPETPETPDKPGEPTKPERSIHIFSGSEEVSTLVFDASNGITSIELTVEANFYWDLDFNQNWPEWIKRLGITDGKKGEDGVYRNTFTLELNDAELDGNDKSGVLTFADIDDENYSTTIPVSYKAIVVPEVPFEIQCSLGKDIHVTKDGIFKDADGKPTSQSVMLDFNVLTENTDELIVITPTGCAYGEGAGFIQTEPNNRFVTIAKGDKIDGGVNYKMFVTPGLLENAKPKSICDMAYIFVFPKAVYAPYEKYFSARDTFYEMAFMYMRIDNYLFTYLTDEEGNKVTDSHGNIVSVPKDSIKKYMLRVFVDAE